MIVVLKCTRTYNEQLRKVTSKYCCQFKLENNYCITSLCTIYTILYENELLYEPMLV